VATTGWHRDHARKALRSALQPTIVKPRPPRTLKYGPKVIAALVFCWAVLGMPAGKRLAPILPELVSILRRHDELDIDDDTATLLGGMSAATIDPGWPPNAASISSRAAPAPSRARCSKARSRSAPGRTGTTRCLGSSRSTWCPTTAATPPVSTPGTLAVTDIATGWTETRSVRNKAEKWVIAALDDIATAMPFPILGVDSDNGSEFINHHLKRWCEKRRITFTRSRPGNKNDGCHVEQKNWAIVRIVVGYHRYDTPAELLLLNKIWARQSLMTNYSTHSRS
jgi:hypothetical protein